ncbi:MAG: hypothetical protein ACOH18_03150 [Candidatus Saccharimonadaceae bacterium]
MKVFVSGQINDLKYVRKVQAEFIAAGHEITHDWTTNEGGEKMLSSRKSKLENIQESRKRSYDDVNGVVNSDIYVICTDNKKVGKGMYVELGAAIGLNARFKSPKIFVLGKLRHVTIFYLHPSVVHVNSVDEILTHCK